MKQIISFVAILLVWIDASYTQNIDIKTERRVNLAVYQAITEYESFSASENKSSIRGFIGLFENPETEIFNDLLGLSLKDKLSVGEYSRLINEKAQGTYVTIKNIRKSAIEDGGDVWLTTVNFAKELVYSTDCDVILSSKEYYGVDYNMEVVYAYDKKTGSCLIRSLEGKINSDNPKLSEDFAVLQKTSKYDELVTEHGRKLQFNSYDQAFVPGDYSLDFYDDDVSMKIVKENVSCNIIKLKYKPHHWRIKPHADITIGEFFKGDYDSMNGHKFKSSEIQFGLDIGYVFPTSSKFKTGVFLGAGISSSKIEAKIGDLNYDYQASSLADMDGDTYQRYYELKNVSQTAKLMDLVVPLYVDFEYRFIRRFSLYADLGAKAYLNLNNKVTSFMNSYSYGIYPQYQNLRMEDEWLNNFGRHTYSLTDRESQLEAKLCVDAFASAGARMWIIGPLSLDFGVTYQMGFMNAIGQHTSNDGTNNQQLVSYTVAEGEKVKNLVEAYGNFKHNAFKVNVGLILKF